MPAARQQRGAAVEAAARALLEQAGLRLVVGGPRARATDVLSKPYRRSELLDRVRLALNRRGEAGARRQRSDFGAVQM